MVPVLCLLEKGVAVGEGPDPWDASECGVDVVMSHLEAARSIAHHGGLYCTNAESKLHGIHCFLNFINEDIYYKYSSEMRSIHALTININIVENDCLN